MENLMDNPFEAPETNQETQDTQVRKLVLCGLLIVAVGLPGFKWAFGPPHQTDI